MQDTPEYIFDDNRKLEELLQDDILDQLTRYGTLASERILNVLYQLVEINDDIINLRDKELVLKYVKESISQLILIHDEYKP